MRKILPAALLLLAGCSDIGSKPYPIKAGGHAATARVSFYSGIAGSYDIDFEQNPYGLAWMNSPGSLDSSRGNGVPGIKFIAVRCKITDSFGRENDTETVYVKTAHGWDADRSVYNKSTPVCPLPDQAPLLAKQAEEAVRQAVEKDKGKN